MGSGDEGYHDMGGGGGVTVRRVKEVPQLGEWREGL